MSQSSDDAHDGPHHRHRRTAAARGAAPGHAAVAPLDHRGQGEGAGLLIVGLLLPWNLYLGVGIPDSNTTPFAVLGAVTLLSLIAVALPGTERWADRLRLGLNVPYLLLVLAFVGFDVFETVRFGGTVTVPGGVGPGAWLVSPGHC